MSTKTNIAMVTRIANRASALAVSVRFSSEVSDTAVGGVGDRYTGDPMSLPDQTLLRDGISGRKESKSLCLAEKNEKKVVCDNKILSVKYNTESSQ
ncbi:hypothetical protein L1987_65037 [Smallanthus sonchifolius]|uniref:Uncharacterized protein n=1 Tax=Smallanthus sonchifolius TaxID=185202 RepID=A0ACB9BT94_9ASTR|nr:hypothetical protein L1987_65037 [Smallanthus sonchifolius]